MQPILKLMSSERESRPGTTLLAMDVMVFAGPDCSSNYHASSRLSSVSLLRRRGDHAGSVGHERKGSPTHPHLRAGLFFKGGLQHAGGKIICDECSKPRPSQFGKGYNYNPDVQEGRIYTLLNDFLKGNLETGN